MIKSNSDIRGFEEDVMTEFSWPKCQVCGTGELLPLSDFGNQGAAVHYKAWVCSNPDCLFNLKIRNGEIHLNQPVNISDGSSPRMR